MDHKHDHSHGHHDHGTHGGAQAQADSGKAIDPVCGMQVKIKPEARHRDYEGQTFYFCSDGCQSKFDVDPWFYASGAAAKVEKTPRRARNGPARCIPRSSETNPAPARSAAWPWSR